MRWLPIETAPKDRKIVVREPDGVRDWSSDAPKEFKTYVQFARWEDGDWSVCDEQTGGYWGGKPTHWFDIPSDDAGFE